MLLVTRRFSTLASSWILGALASAQASAPDWRLDGDRPGAHLGSAMVGADFDGDGFGDLLVSAPDENGRFPGEGRVSLHLGSSAGLGAAPVWTMRGGRPGARFGSVLAAADVNGDGIADALIGAPDFDPRLRLRSLDGSGPIASGQHGRVWVVLGSPAGLLDVPQRVLTGQEPGERLGASLADAGDTNGDGFEDLIVGSTGNSGGRGRIRVYLGSSAGVLAAPAWNVLGLPGAGWGRLVGSAGDVSGDGRADILVSAHTFGGICGNQDVFLGSAGGPSPMPVATSTPGISVLAGSRDFDLDGVPESLYIPRCGDRLVVRDYPGGTVLPYPLELPRSAVAGDWNGSGRPQPAAGLPDFGYEGFHGRVQAFTSFLDFPRAARVPRFDGDEPDAGWGEALASVDVDGDGADELFIGAPRQDTGALDAGLVAVYRGFAPGKEITSTGDNAVLSAYVRDVDVGDFDGDGFTDALAATSANWSEAEVRYGSATGLGSVSTVRVAPPAPPRESRSVTFSVGDVDGDGRDDVLAEFATFDPTHGGTDGERITGLYLGSPSGLSTTPSATPSVGAAFLGDVNGDGLDDASVVSTPSFLQDVYLGTPSGLSTTPAAGWSGVPGGTLGNLNGDGLPDLVRFDSSSVDVYLNSPSGFVFAGTWSGFAPGSNSVLAALADVDGDGLDDLVTFDFNDSQKYRVYRRASVGFERAPQWWESPLPPGSSISYENPRLVSLLDLDGDGRADLLFPESLHLGTGAGFERRPAWTGDLPAPGGEPPSLRTFLTDFDGDGRPELVTKAPFVAPRVVEITPP